MPKWTPEQARAFAVKGGEASKRRRAELKAMATNPGLITAQPNQHRDYDRYAPTMLARVRKDIDGIADRLRESVRADEIDAQQIDRLAAAWAKLAELERQYADRPLPGTKKPVSVRAARPASDDEFAPVVVEVPQPVVV